jgi:hypothetical protein
MLVTRVARILRLMISKLGKRVDGRMGVWMVEGALSPVFADGGKSLSSLSTLVSVTRGSSTVWHSVLSMLVHQFRDRGWMVRMGGTS